MLSSLVPCWICFTNIPSHYCSIGNHNVCLSVAFTFFILIFLSNTSCAWIMMYIHFCPLQLKDDGLDIKGEDLSKGLMVCHLFSFFFSSTFVSSQIYSEKPKSMWKVYVWMIIYSFHFLFYFLVHMIFFFVLLYSNFLERLWYVWLRNVDIG